MRRQVVIIAHRGASAVAPESTRAAIEEAIRAGADMVELDVQLTRDGRLVVFHDDRLERTTDGMGRVVDTTYARLKQLDAGQWFDPHLAGQRILLVSEAVRLIPQRTKINLELKRTPRRQALLQRLLHLVRRERLRGRLLVSSFDPLLLGPLRRTGMMLALICRRHPDRSLGQAIRLGCSAWHPFHTLVSSQRMVRAHRAGLKVHAWTVDDVGRARRLIHRGVDGLFTNHPARLRTLKA